MRVTIYKRSDKQHINIILSAKLLKELENPERILLNYSTEYDTYVIKLCDIDSYSSKNAKNVIRGIISIGKYFELPNGVYIVEQEGEDFIIVK